MAAGIISGLERSLIGSVLSVIPALLVVFFVAGGKIDWTVLVIGLAWRGWLLLYMLPFLSAALLAGVSD